MSFVNQRTTFSRTASKKGLRFLLLLIVLVGVGVLGYSDVFFSF